MRRERAANFIVNNKMKVSYLIKEKKREIDAAVKDMIARCLVSYLCFRHGLPRRL